MLCEFALIDTDSGTPLLSPRVYCVSAIRTTIVRVVSTSPSDHRPSPRGLSFRRLVWTTAGTAMLAGLPPSVSWHAANQQSKNDRLELAAAFEAISRLQAGDWSLDAVITGLTLLSRHPSSEAAKLAGELFVSSIDERPSLAAALREAVNEASWLSAAHRKGLLRVVAQVESVVGVSPDSSEEEGEEAGEDDVVGSGSGWARGGGRSSGGRWDRFPRPAYDGWRDADRMPVDASYPFTMPHHTAPARHPAPDAYAAWPHDGDGDEGAEECEGAEESEGVGETMAAPVSEGGTVDKAHSRRRDSRRAAWLADSTRRVHADQQGWRDEDAQQASRGNTLRGWVAATTSRDEEAAPLQADIVRGLWTCCKQIDPEHPGCVTAMHTTAEQRCERCASWVPRAKWGVEACVAHAAECRWLRYHGVEWPCCGDASLKHTRWATRTPEEWMARRDAGLTTHEWATRCHAEGYLGSGGGDGTHSYSFHLHARAIKPPGGGPRPPCFGCRKLAKHTAAPLPSCPSCMDPDKETSQGRDDKRCPSCGAEQQLCTQCQRWVPLSAWDEEHACTFHPGVWCADRPVRQVRVHGEPREEAPHSEAEEEEEEQEEEVKQAKVREKKKKVVEEKEAKKEKVKEKRKKNVVEEEEALPPSPPPRWPSRPSLSSEVQRVPPYFGMPSIYLAIPARVKAKLPPKPVPKLSPEQAAATRAGWAWQATLAMHWPADYALPDEDELLRPKQSPRSRPDSPRSHPDAVPAVRRGRGGRGGSEPRSKSRSKSPPDELRPKQPPKQPPRSRPDAVAAVIGGGGGGGDNSGGGDDRGSCRGSSRGGGSEQPTKSRPETVVGGGGGGGGGSGGGGGGRGGGGVGSWDGRGGSGGSSGDSGGDSGSRRAGGWRGGGRGGRGGGGWGGVGGSGSGGGRPAGCMRV